MLLVTGANGQLGNELKPLLPDAIFTDSDMLDITNSAAVEKFVRENNIDTIINCAAYTAVDRAESEPEQATFVNSIGPNNLAKTGAKLIHISTDYVFDGKNYRPYVETDPTDPQSVYGKTKHMGEVAVMESATTAIIIRTSWLYSSFGNNFVKTMRRLGDERDSLNVIFDQVGTPTYAADLAAAIVQIIPQIKPGQKEIYHFSNEGVCSWYDFAAEIMKVSGLRCVVNPIMGKDYPLPAPRPFYSVLNKAKIRADFGIEIAHWSDALRRCIDLL